jgi:hypothetical protein
MISHLLNAEKTMQQTRNFQQVAMLQKVKENGAANDDAPAEMLSKDIACGLWLLLGLTVGFYFLMTMIFSILEYAFAWWVL